VFRCRSSSPGQRVRLMCSIAVAEGGIEMDEKVIAGVLARLERAGADHEVVVLPCEVVTQMRQQGPYPWSERANGQRWCDALARLNPLPEPIRPGVWYAHDGTSTRCWCERILPTGHLVIWEFVGGCWCTDCLSPEISSDLVPCGAPANASDLFELLGIEGDR
jgi:hypothetical protein